MVELTPAETDVIVALRKAREADYADEAKDALWSAVDALLHLLDDESYNRIYLYLNHPANTNYLKERGT